jgi:thiol-disulfide isomerase/thioredoxin
MGKYVLCLGLWWSTHGAVLIAQKDWKERRFRQILSEKKYTVWVFLSDDCPICQKYLPRLRQLSDSLADQVHFVGIFPTMYPNLPVIQSFVKKNALPFDTWIDRRQRLTRRLGAQTTPEVFLTNKRGQILYRGMVDDWFYALGKNRKQATQHFLRDAIAAAIQQQPIAIPQTQAVGCDIQLK